MYVILSLMFEGFLLSDYILTKTAGRPLACRGWNCSTALHFRVRYSVMGGQNYFTGCFSAFQMDIRSENPSLYDFPMLKDMSFLSYWVCLHFSIGHGTKICVALCDHTNHPSLLVTIKSFSLFLKVLWMRFHSELTYYRWSSACEHREGKHPSKTPLWSI